MVFVNVKKPAVQGKKQVFDQGKKCMNCGMILDNPVGGIDARRFCSQDCKGEYLGLK